MLQTLLFLTEWSVMSKQSDMTLSVDKTTWPSRLSAVRMIDASTGPWTIIFPSIRHMWHWTISAILNRGFLILLTETVLSFGFPIVWLWAFLMRVIPETCTIKRYISNLVRTTRFWNMHHQVRSMPK